MLTFRLVLILITTLAAPQAASGDNAKVHQPVDHDAVALADMRQFGEQHFVIVGAVPGTLRVVGDWSATHVLRWADFDAGNEIVRIYHATNRHNHALRYVSLGDGHHGRHHEWKPVH